MNSIEAYIQFTPGLITADGEITEEPTATFLENYMREFHRFIERVYTVLPRSTA
jgi:chromate reductase